MFNSVGLTLLAVDSCCNVPPELAAITEELHQFVAK